MTVGMGCYAARPKPAMHCQKVTRLVTDGCLMKSNVLLDNDI